MLEQDALERHGKWHSNKLLKNWFYLSMNPESFLLGNNLFSCLTLPFQIYQAYLGHKPSKHFQNMHPKVATRMCSSTTILINPIPASYYHQVFFLQIYCPVTFPGEATPDRSKTSKKWLLLVWLGKVRSLLQLLKKSTGDSDSCTSRAHPRGREDSEKLPPPPYKGRWLLEVVLSPLLWAIAHYFSNLREEPRESSKFHELCEFYLPSRRERSNP